MNNDSGVDFSGVPEYHLELVRDRTIPLKKVLARGKSTELAADVLHAMTDKSPVEQLIALYVDLNGDLVGAERLAIGDLASVAQDPRNLLRGAVVASVPTVIIGHNHPTGDPYPSDADITFTVMTVQAASAIHIEVFDHIVVAPAGKHYSIFEHKSEIGARIDKIAMDIKMRQLLAEDHWMVKPLVDPPVGYKHGDLIADVQRLLGLKRS
jgi:proteasome lid subunit RPN8/RPN11